MVKGRSYSPLYCCQQTPRSVWVGLMPKGNLAVCCILFFLLVWFSRKYGSENSLSTSMLFQTLSLCAPSLLNHCLPLMLASEHSPSDEVIPLKYEHTIWTGNSRFIKGKPNKHGQNHSHLFRKFTVFLPMPCFAICFICYYCHYFFCVCRFLMYVILCMMLFISILEWVYK